MVQWYLEFCILPCVQYILLHLLAWAGMRDTRDEWCRLLEGALLTPIYLSYRYVVKYVLKKIILLITWKSEECFWTICKSVMRKSSIFQHPAARKYFTVGRGQSFEQRKGKIMIVVNVVKQSIIPSWKECGFFSLYNFLKFQFVILLSY